jgi:hypothetical protein
MTQRTVTTQDDAAVQVLPTGPVWFSAWIGDGDAHYGPLDADGMVTGACGIRFRPRCNPVNGWVAWWRHPVDATHGCQQCLHAGTDRTSATAQDA